MRKGYLSHRRPAKDQSNLRIRAVSPEPSLFANMKYEVDKGSDQTPVIQPHWMAGHALLKNEFTEDEKYHNLMKWL